MATISISRHFDAPIERVWSLAMDLPRWPQWFPSILEVRDINGPTDRVGTTALLVAKGPDRVHQMRLELTRVEPPSVHGHAAAEVGGGMAYESLIRLTPSGNGTDMEWQRDTSPAPGLLGGLVDRLLVGRMSERQMREACEGFQAMLDQQTPAEAG